MTIEEKINLLNKLLEIEEKNDIGDLTRAERGEFQQWVNKSLEQEPRWITLSEKWPEDCQEVFVTTDEGDIVTDVFHVDSGGYYFEDRDVEYVTAWMPLFIKPYKEESEDKEYEGNNNIKYRRH